MLIATETVDYVDPFPFIASIHHASSTGESGVRMPAVRFRSSLLRTHSRLINIILDDRSMAMHGHGAAKGAPELHFQSIATRFNSPKNELV